MLNYAETPVQEINEGFLKEAGIRLLIKREDLNHPSVSGNKWWKLKYNLEEAKRLGVKTILTFGGAFSNHIYATAAAAKDDGFESIGVIRGERVEPLNPILAFAKAKRMQFHFISRGDYRLKSEKSIQEELRKKFGDFYLIPEGGTNELGVRGCAEFARKLLDEIDFDLICLPVATGGTFAGLVRGLNGKKQLIGFSVVKGDFLSLAVRNLLGHDAFINWQVLENYHFGGYAKSSPKLDDFINDFYQKHGIPLDRIYTGKAMYGIYDLIRKEKIDRGSVVLFLHTGGAGNMS